MPEIGSTVLGVLAIQSKKWSVHFAYSGDLADDTTEHEHENKLHHR